MSVMRRGSLQGGPNKGREHLGGEISEAPKLGSNGGGEGSKLKVGIKRHQGVSASLWVVTWESSLTE